MSEESEEAFLISDNDPVLRNARMVLGMYDAPAFVRRARKVQDAIDALRQKCLSQRQEFLDAVRMRLRGWNRLVDAQPSIQVSLPENRRRWAQELNEQLFASGAPRLSVASPGRPDGAWRALVESVERFNRRWRRFASSMDVSAANRLIEGYNRYYLLEKECLVRSSRTASRGFTPMAPLTEEWALGEFPLLPEAPAGKD